MNCCHYHAPAPDGDEAFAVDPPSIVFGRGVLREAGAHAAALGISRVALFTDPRVASTEYFMTLRASLRQAGIDVAVYDEVVVEPTDASFKIATLFASESEVDGFISLGGGSVIDTAKAANLYSTYPADFLDYVNAPIGAGLPIPGPLKPHIACPTTCGSGSESTGIAVFDLREMRTKTGIAGRELRPNLGLIDPNTTRSLPRTVVASSAFDVLSHALESFTARPYNQRAKAARSDLRPMSQGANPWSDLGCREALRLLGDYMVRAASDADDDEAREKVMWATALAGIAFGNAGCHAPHGMSYGVSGLARDFRPSGYPLAGPMVPHGMSVIVNAPALFRFTAETSPERHLEGARLLGADVGDAAPENAGEVLAEEIISLMRRTSMPNGLSGLGYNIADVEALTKRASAQQRLLDNAPREITSEDLTNLFTEALSYWEAPVPVVASSRA